MRAIVLSGGGSRGSYQIGVWKALRKLKIEYDIITGTSVGALNGALMVQNSYYKAYRIWKKINMKTLFGNDIANPKTKRDLIKIYRDEFLKNGGMKIKKLQNLIDKNINKDKFFKSKTNYGLITVNISDKKALQLEKKDLEEELLSDYLIASASCYPAFQLKEINGDKFIDGGMFDNLPINLAIKLGAHQIIAVDLCAPGMKKRIKNKKNTMINIIKPNNKLNNFLDFNKKEAMINIKYGYNDTMKAFNKYFGIKYTFKSHGFDKNIKEYKQIFLIKANNILHNKRIISLDIDKINTKLLLKTAENIGYIFKINDTKIYHLKKYNKLLLKKLKYYIKHNELRTKQINNIINLYNMCKNNNYKNIGFKNFITSKDLLMAIYLYCLDEV